MAWFKTAVTPLLTHWSYCSLALSYWNSSDWNGKFVIKDYMCLPCASGSKLVNKLVVSVVVAVCHTRITFTFEMSNMINEYHLFWSSRELIYISLSPLFRQSIHINSLLSNTIACIFKLVCQTCFYRSYITTTYLTHKFWGIFVLIKLILTNSKIGNYTSEL